MERIKRLEKDFELINDEIEKLESFRDTTLLRKFKRQLLGELSTLRNKIKITTETREQKEEEKQKKRNKANRNRSVKNKRVWKYVKSIKENYFPDKSLKDIRASLKNHRKGLETDIPDVVWRNPSP